MHVARASGGRVWKSGAGREMLIVDDGVVGALAASSSLPFFSIPSSPSLSPTKVEDASGLGTSTIFLYPKPCRATFSMPLGVGGRMNIPVDMFSNTGMSFNLCASDTVSCVYASTCPVAWTRPRKSRRADVQAPVARMVSSAYKQVPSESAAPTTLLPAWFEPSGGLDDRGSEKRRRTTFPLLQLKFPRLVPSSRVWALTSLIAPSASAQPLRWLI